MFWRIVVERATQWAALGLLRNNTLEVRLISESRREMCYEINLLRIMSESGMIAVSSRHGVSGPIIPTARLLIARWIRVSGPVIYIHMYIYQTADSSMDNLGASLLSTWIREIFLEISQPDGQSELCYLRVRRLRSSATILHLKLLHLSVGIKYEFQHLLHRLHLMY